MKHLEDRIALHDGCSIPCVGYGTWKTPDGETAENSVYTAIQQGYRHIDTAAVYGNEKSVGRGIARALKDTGLNREDLFVTSKVWNTERGYEKTLAACQKSLDDLQLEYLDLYLIHWPANARQFENWDEINQDTWKAMIELKKQGKVKTIGVSNFKPHHLKSLLSSEEIPAIDQIEFHPGMDQEDALSFCREHNIQVEAWSPLGNGKVLSSELVQKLAQKYGKTPAQICIRYCMQKGTVPLPKSITPSRIEENGKVFDFELESEDMDLLDQMPSFGQSGSDPDMVNF